MNAFQGSDITPKPPLLLEEEKEKNLAKSDWVGPRLQFHHHKSIPRVDRCPVTNLMDAEYRIEDDR